MPAPSINPQLSMKNSSSGPQQTLVSPPPSAVATDSTQFAVQPAPGSPVAPAYSPITPKAQPVLPATVHSPPPLIAPPADPPHRAHDSNHATFQQRRNQPSPPPPINTMPPAEYIPEPPTQPFSSEDSTDAIALRAAISSLQFQKKKAHDDLRALEKLRGQALEDPAYFRQELEAGRLREQKPTTSTWQAILDAEDSDDDSEDIDMDGQDQEGSKTGSGSRSRRKDEASLASIPGPQNVVRMPYINWDKYSIDGSGLERLHAQQQRWPGTSFAYNGNSGRGREHVVASPYNPWLDTLEGEGGGRQAEAVAGTGPSTVATPTTVSEHPMETRRGSRMQ